MNIEKAYYHIFNRISDLNNLLEDQRDGEVLNIPWILRAIQSEAEESCISD